MESTTLNALRTLLHHPQLALKVDDAGTLAREQDTYAQLLVFDAAPGYGEAQPRKSWNKDKKPWDGKKWDGKKKWDKGGRGDFKAPQR
ncbi:hypothetical protein ACLXAZ_32960, partial [Escherichia coli]